MFRKILLTLIIFSIGVGFGSSYLNKNQNQPKISPTESFISEVYDKIKDNYWDNITDTQLLDLFKQSFEKNSAGTIITKLETKDKLLKSFLDSTKNMDEDKKNKFTAVLAGTVLTSLNPPGRSGLFTSRQEEQLKNTVDNINPQKNLYQDLGLNKGASSAAIKQAFQEKSKAADTPDKLKQLAYAKEVLTQKDQKINYDQKGIEPTIFSKIIDSSILYIQFKKFSPSSYDEFIRAFDTFKDNTILTGLIFDLRGNIGGAIDSTAYFLGNFIGKNQYAFDFYHKGEYLPIKTPTDKLPAISKYKQIVVLVDNQTQSSAEIMAAAIKKYHVGVLTGTTTKGWGTVEKVFPIDNQFDKSVKYSLFLVHSVTLRDDNLPIEGRGVEPDVNTKNPDWQQQLFSYFRNQQLINAVASVNSIQ